MRSRASLVIAAAALASFLLGVILGNWRLVVLPIPLVVLLALSTLLLPPQPRLVVTREVEPAEALEGGRAKVTLGLRNEGDALDLLEVFDDLPREMRLVGGSNHAIFSLDPESEAVVEYEVEAPRSGDYVLGPLTVRSRDALGFHVEEVVINLTTRFFVGPRTEPLKGVDLRPRRTRPWFGNIPSRRRGLGMDFINIREYQPSDDMRRINWKASARVDGLLTNEFEGERTSDVVIVLDAREVSALGPPATSLLDHSIRATASLAAKMLANRNRVGLIIQREVLDWVYPAFGRKQYHRIVHRLVGVRPAGTWPLEYVAGVLTRFFPPQSQIVIVSPLTDRRATEGIMEVVARGFEVAVVSPSPLGLHAPAAPDDPLLGIGLRILELERSNVLAELRSFATVVDWDPLDPLASPLKAVRPRPRR